MKNSVWMLIMVMFFTITTVGCTAVKPDGDEEAVLIEKPLFFGRGGVQKEAVPSGLTWEAFSTWPKYFKITPQAWKETFDDMSTNDRYLVDFDAYFTVQIQKGKSPKLYEEKGELWYENNVSPMFRSVVRDKVSEKDMFVLMADRIVLAAIETEITDKMRSYFKEIDIPVDVIKVTIGKVTPPPAVLEETARTAAQDQAKLTQDARTKAETARKFAEQEKAKADKAYMQEMNMTTQEYLGLRWLEVQKEQVEMVRNKENVTVSIVSGSAMPTFSVK